MSASAGTLMAAALETAGYHAQERVLVELASMYTGIAGLLFTATLLMAVAVIAMRGEYKIAIWFLLGPGLFYFVVGNRTPADGAQWAMGAFKAPPETINEHVERKESDVLWLFAAYNNLVSSVVQEATNIILNQDTKRQMLFMTRQQIMDEIMGAELRDGRLLGLLRLGISGHCRKQFEGMRRLASANRSIEQGSSIDYVAATGDVSRFSTNAFNVTASPEIAVYLRELFSSIKAAGADDWVEQRWCNMADAGLDEANRIGFNAFFSRPQSCARIWCWTGLAFAREANALMRRAEERYLEDNDFRPTNLYEEIWQHVAVKMSPPDLTDYGIADPADTTPDPSVIPAIISGLLLRKAMTQDPRSQTATQFARHSGVTNNPINFRPETSLQDIDRFNQKFLNHQMAKALKWETFHFAMMMPYLQGFLLYIGAVSFPFFAILLVIPGKAQAFFMWMTLWAWLKTWDIGWALIYVADDVMWNLMPQSAHFAPDVDPNHGPINLFEAAFEGDPAYSMSTYYMMLGVMLNAVPLVSAQVMLGAKSAVAGQLVGGMKSMSEKLGGWNADYTATIQTQRLNALGETYRVNWTNRKLKEKFNTETAELDRMATIARARGQSEQAMGSTIAMGGVAGAALGTVGLVVSGFFTGGATWVMAVGVAAVAVGAGAGVYGTVRHSAGVSEERTANSQLSSLVQVNGKAWYERTNYATGVMRINAMRQGIMSRGQYYDPVSSQDHIVADLMKIRMVLEGTQTYAEAKEVGGRIAAVREGINAGVNVYSMKGGG